VAESQYLKAKRGIPPAEAQKGSFMPKNSSTELAEESETANTFTYAVEIGVVDCKKLENICFSDGHLYIPHHQSSDEGLDWRMLPDTQVLILSAGCAIGTGQLAGGFALFNSGELLEMVKVKLIGWAKKPIKLSPLQLKAIEDSAARSDQREPETDNFILLDTEAGNSLSTTLRNCLHRFELPRNSSEWRHRQRMLIHSDEALSAQEKLSLVEAFEGLGDFREEVIDLHQEVIMYEYDRLVCCPIIPWESAPPEIRLDPHNYLLMPSAVAENFQAGLITFCDQGGMEFAEPMLESAFELGVDPNYEMLSLTERQRQYLRFHRQKLFGQWLANRESQNFDPSILLNPLH